MFAEIPTELREKLVAALRSMKFPVGGALMTERALPDDFHILMRGKARLLGMARRAGEESVSLGLFERGAFFGAASLASRRPLETVIASTEVLTLALSREEFLRLWEGRGELSRAVRESCDAIGSVSCAGRKRRADHARGGGRGGRVRAGFLPAGGSREGRANRGRVGVVLR